MSWIKCSERMPDINRRLWFVVNGKRVESGVLSDNSTWRIGGTSSYYTNKSVTHWQYDDMPEPPKDGE